MNKIKVLVIDDSYVFREMISRGIATDSMINVIGTASDPFDASKKIVDLEPDVITCDIEMPRMNGIEFIRQLMPQYPIPAVVVSSVSKAVFDAIEAGAVEFVTKPNAQTVNGMENFLKELIMKLKIASTANIQSRNKNTMLKASMQGQIDRKIVTKKIIAIGASTGGTEAICNIIQHMPIDMPGMVIVQHIPPVFSKMFAERLNNTTHLHVKEAQNGDYVDKGSVLISPGDAHMRIKKIGDKLKVECFKGEKRNGHCPSVDVLFESVAREAGSDSIGVILTGMGYDGAKGLLSMRRKGATTIGQDKASSVVYGMPKVAYDIGAVERQAPLRDIPGILSSLLGHKNG